MTEASKEIVRKWMKEKKELEELAEELRKDGDKKLADAILRDHAANMPDFVIEGYYNPADDSEDK